ncbi:hypothetical protein [Maricaulis sp.]|uniref:hypothetical protein n=1 Tax=Maricaulis sp. TaxID=1486257 RepID=UPI003A901C28
MSDASNTVTARPMRRYDVTVGIDGTFTVLAATRSKAVYELFLDWSEWGDMTFGDFLRRCSARLAASQPASDGYERLRTYYPGAIIPAPGTRITAEGLTGTVLPALRSTQYVIFQPDGLEREALVHPASVQLEGGAA